MIDFSGINLPFNASDLLGSGVSLLKVVSGFVLLGLSFVLAQFFIYLIEKAIATHKDNKLNADKPRDQYSFFSAVRDDLVENKLYNLKHKFRR